MVKKRMLITGLAMMIMLSLIACSQPAPVTTTGGAWKPSKPIAYRSFPVETAGYAMSLGIAVAIEKATGVRMTVPPTDSSKAHFASMRDGTEEFTTTMADEAWLCLNGMDPFNTPDWGAQSIRFAWFGSAWPQGFGTGKNSGIKTLNDLKGKRVPRTPPGTPDEIFWEAMFAYMRVHPDYNDLTWADLKQVPSAGYDEGIDAMITGAVDVAIMSFYDPTPFEIEASQTGLYVIPVPNETANDKKAWAAFHEIMPCFSPVTVTKDVAGLRDTGGKEQIWGPRFAIYCYDFLDFNTAYWMTSQIHQQYDNFKQAHVSLVDWSIDKAIGTPSDWFVPWHEGSVKYFKDIGRWTADMQAKQDALLKQYPQANTRSK